MNRVFSVWKLLFVLQIVTFLIHLPINIVFHKQWDLMHCVFESALLVVAIFPVFYYVLVKPLKLELKLLSGLFPVCCVCKSIRKDDGEWETIEEHLHEVKFTHGYCPKCANKLLKELDREVDKNLDK